MNKLIRYQYSTRYAEPYALIMRRGRFLGIPVSEWKQVGFVQSLAQLVRTMQELKLRGIRLLDSPVPNELALLQSYNYDFLGAETMTGERVFHKHVPGCEGIWYGMDARSLTIKLNGATLIYRIRDAAHLAAMIEMAENIIADCTVLKYGENGQN